MTKWNWALAPFVLIVACAGAAPNAEEPRADPEPTDEAEPTPAQATAPADFAISATGGPVARWMAAGMTETTSRIEPGATPGTFVLLVQEWVVDEMGLPGPAREVARVPVDADDVAAIHAIVRERRAELEGQCFDPTIMDGATSSFGVRANGEDLTFSCTNASTPAFLALATEYGRVVQAYGPAR